MTDDRRQTTNDLSKSFVSKEVVWTEFYRVPLAASNSLGCPTNRGHETFSPRLPSPWQGEG